jgi:hypothetical protein
MRVFDDEKPITLTDSNTGEQWEITPSDPLYEIIRANVVVVNEDKLEQVRKWWYTKAEERIQQSFQKIPWKDLVPSQKDVQSATLQSLSEKLALISYYLGDIIQQKAFLESSLSLMKRAFEQSLEKRLMNYEGSGTKAERRIQIIDSNPILKIAMIEIWETEALIIGLNGLQERLDLLWKTTSRILTAKLKEPLD